LYGRLFVCKPFEASDLRKRFIQQLREQDAIQSPLLMQLTHIGGAFPDLTEELSYWEEAFDWDASRETSSNSTNSVVCKMNLFYHGSDSSDAAKIR
jgi:hypothetical protein